MGYLVKPFTKADLAPAIEMATARWQQMRDLEIEVDDLGDRLAARDIVERAKARLQAEHGVSESDAFALLRKQAMDTRVTLAEVSASVLEIS
jgi:response regulator NasT